jgi:lysophospholipase L1-like esterase
MKALSSLVGLAAAAIAVAAVVSGAQDPVRAESSAPAVACAAPTEIVRLENPLTRVALRVATAQPLKIVAIGSSSTFGAGASSPENSYPSRLASELKLLFPDTAVTVVNRGVNGENVRDMLARFNRDVFAENPDLVLWQVGSNAVLQGVPVEQASAPLREGLSRLREADADVVLISPQYAPKVIAKTAAGRMVALIEATAQQTRVDLFRRFAVMRHWHVNGNIPFNRFVSQDGLHMNDWSYGCIARLLAGAIHEAATRSAVTATARARR